MIDSPLFVFFVALFAQWGAAHAGDRLRKRVRPIKGREREDLDTVLTATLTLFALIIGFSFSMAVSRYDQRKNYEEAEANAIGTEYLRADLLPADDAAKVRELLRAYVERRIQFYNGQAIQGSEQRAMADAELWSTVVRAAAGQQATLLLALTLSGMNDVLNSQGYTQAAWLNRIPPAAWALMGLIAIFANLLLGYREHSTGRLAPMILPMIASIAFFLIADIDSPNGGVIHVAPYNLMATAESMKPR